MTLTSAKAKPSGLNAPPSLAILTYLVGNGSPWHGKDLVSDGARLSEDVYSLQSCCVLLSLNSQMEKFCRYFAS